MRCGVSRVQVSMFRWVHGLPDDGTRDTPFAAAIDLICFPRIAIAAF
jgi:hypothetical protein